MKKLFLLIPVLILALAPAFALIDQPEPPTRKECSDISSLGLVKHGIMLDNEKVLAFFNADDSSLSYFCVKQILGVWDYDMYLEITALDGKYLALNDVLLVYGVYPGKITSDYILKQIDTNNLIYTIYGWMSPNHVTTSYLVTQSSTIRQQQIQAMSNGNGGETILASSTNPYEYSIAVLDALMVDSQSYRTARTFSRLMLIETDSGYQLVKLTLGVWI